MQDLYFVSEASSESRESKDDLKIEYLSEKESYLSDSQLLTNTKICSWSISLSKDALSSLKDALSLSYGSEMANKFKEEDLNILGYLILTVLAESLKLEMAVSPLPVIEF